jgi:general secretion pathway protein G
MTCIPRVRGLPWTEASMQSGEIRKGARKLTPDYTSLHGFTMIELMIVLTIISILVSIAIPIANSAILRAKEAVLQSNLHTLRTLIDQYTADKLKAPQSLDDLVTAGYLRAIPKDPITNAADWEVVMEDTSLFPEQTEVGIADIHSSSNANSSAGTPYSSW